ncbi:MAG: EAL domain-containing protein [Pseudomonadota bacterium]|nr:EAL domain-containing protein [Pseudomonadota bacterium]
MRLLKPLSRRIGPRRTRWLANWAVAIIAGALLCLALVFGVFAPQLADDGGNAGTLMLGLALTLAVGLLVVAVLTWRLTVMTPLLAWPRKLRQRRLRQRERTGKTSTTVAVNNEVLAKRTEQLNAMAQLNRSMREKMAMLDNSRQVSLRLRDAALSTTLDAVLLTDHAGVIIGVSPATATMLRAPRESVVGKNFDHMVPLFDDSTGLDTTRPLREFLSRVIQSRSAIPLIQQATLVNQENEPLPVFITAGAVLNSSGQAVGCTVRLARADKAEGSSIQVTQNAITDADLAGWGDMLLSREPFDRRLGELISEATLTGTPHTLLFVRVDDLEGINARAGYLAGEQALSQAAKNFSMALVDSGTGYRYSNSRFAALLTGHSEEFAKELSERIRQHAESHPLVWEGKPIKCTFSIAVLPINRESANSTRVLAAAENLLADARGSGGNRIQQQQTDDTTIARRRDDKTWLEWLLPRLDNGKAHLISQEAHSLAGGSVPMLEFFIRVEDDDGVWLEPGYYLPAIERLHQAQKIDLWVIRNLLTALATDPKVLQTHSMVSVNLAPQSMLDPEFAAAVFELLAETAVPLKQLCFEIDELFAISHSDVVQRFTEMLRPTGVRFALDRCHTTMGITQLRHLPIDYMKIHAGVTRNIETDELERRHLAWLCDAAHLLGRKAAAINIESASALPVLRQAGVDYVQGSAVNKMGSVMI